MTSSVAIKTTYMKFLLILIFGSNLFCGTPQQINPYQDVPANYVLNHGDSVLINIWGVSQKQVTQVITPQGQITIEGCAPISLKGKTIPEAAKTIQKSIANHYAGDNVSLSLLKPRMIHVNVQGEVNNPGGHLIHGYSNLLMALQQAGGITDVGSYRQIVHQTGTHTSCVIDLYEYLQGKMNMNAIRLSDGDIIQVMPVERLVTIEGLIKRPATYELIGDENAQDLITYAHGITGDDIEIRVRHRSAEARSMEIIATNNVVNYIPRDGDTISIVKLADQPGEVALVLGDVMNKGRYRLSENANTLKSLLRIATPKLGEKPNAVVVYRDTTLVQIGEKDMNLSGGEKIYVVANLVEVRGAVYSAASFDFNPSLSIEDYIKLAGGCTRKASKKNIFVVETDGRHTSGTSGVRIIPGSTIIVPEK